ncbi:MAG: glycosyltransferase [Cellvibrionales bacterium]|nr:glycosyltransferase [Cellvibrionales bacterium]
MPKKNAFIYPSLSAGNSYVTLQEKAIAECGYHVLPFRKLINKLFTQRDHDDVIVINWLESQAVNTDGSLSIKYFFSFFLKIVLIILSRKKMVWVRHNYKSHSANGLSLWVSNLFQSILESLSDRVVCHSKDHAKATDYFIPHPLYYEGNLSNTKTHAKESFVFIGALMPYKGLDELLTIWPKDYSLDIYGKLTDQVFGDLLKKLANQRKLSVNFHFGFVPDSKLLELLSQYHAMVIPNRPGSSYVSGNYFLAKSYGLPLIARKGSVDLTISPLGTYTFDDEDALCIGLYQLTTNKITKSEIRQQAIESYGGDIVKGAWKALLDSL